MVAKQYVAESEFTLYGQVMQDLADVHFLSQQCKVFCFESTGSSNWLQVKCFESSIAEECGNFSEQYKGKLFLVATDPQRQEAIFFGKQLCILAKYKDGHFAPIDFEDLQPNSAIIEFEKKELKQSADFLKKALSKS